MEQQNKCIAEALLFAAGEPVSTEQIAKVLETDVETAKETVEELLADYDRAHRGMQILRLEKAYQMTTRPEYYPNVQKLYRSGQKIKLSETQLETLAIIAYKQPVTKQEIADIRGVQSDAVVNRLVEFDLVTERGRRKSPGRPVLFGTTDAFLRNFGIESLKDLPGLDPANAEQMEQLRMEQFGREETPAKKPRPIEEGGI